MPKNSYREKFAAAEEEIIRRVTTAPRENGTFVTAINEDGKEIRLALFFNKERLVSETEAIEAIEKWHIDPKQFEYLKYTQLGDKITPGSKPRGFNWEPPQK